MARMFARSILIATISIGAVTAALAQPYGYGMGGPGMMGGYGMGGPGMMGGYMAGPGMMGGYGMGGPGMMGGFGMGSMMSSRNYTCNQDGSVPTFGFRRNVGALNLSADDVRNYLESSLAWNGNPNLKVGTIKEQTSDTVTADIVTKDNSLVERLSFDRRTGFSCFVLETK